MKREIITSLLSATLLMPAIAHAEGNKATQNTSTSSKITSVSKDSKAKGWVKKQGKWYYYDKNGKMVTGTRWIDGKYHKFNNNGVWIGS